MRMGKIIVISLLCLTLAAGAACGDGGQQAQPTPTATPAGKTVHVGPADTGEELTLDVGDWLVATMTCETGYHWYMVTVSNRSVLGHVLEEYVPWWESDAGDNLNRRIWTLEAKTAGTSDIYMVCNGSQGLDPVTAATFNLSVTVR
jgi:predicted secreted protein